MNSVLKESTDLLMKKIGGVGDLKVERAVVGLFFSGVKISGGYGGVCFTPVKDIPQAVCCPSSAAVMPLSGKLCNRAVSDYIDDLDGKSPLRKALGIAVFNALSNMYWDKEKNPGYDIEYGLDAVNAAEFDKSKKAVIVGALVPALKKCVKEGVPYIVLEKDPATIMEHEMPYYRPAEDAPKYLPEADIAIITGTTIINDSIDGILKLIKPGAEVIVAGPSAGMIPDALFNAGATIVGGVRVTKPDDMLDILAEGGSGYHFFGKSAEMTVIRKKS